jgi:L-alanine-DL-glutamate epimerase-like enolase superfamily enzyme
MKSKERLMKITDVKLSEALYIPLRHMEISTAVVPNFLTTPFLQIFTDEGITGISPTAGEMSYDLSKVLIENILKSQVVGEDPLNTERIWNKMYWASLMWGRKGATLSAISAIDIAIWDLKGKILNQPVHKILGGHRDSVPSYGSGVDLAYTHKELVKEVTGFVAAGFKMVKIRAGTRDPFEDLERVKLVREAVGPKVDIAIDVNNAWSLNTAIRMAKKLEEYDIYWLEEPILADEIDNLAKLARETSIPIAAGENHYTKWEFKDLMERGAIKIVQADIGKCGGVTEFIKIAAIADAYGLPVCPHHTEFIDASLLAAIPNGLFHEYLKDFFEPMAQVFVNHIEPRNGEISPLNKPGFGVEINMEAIERLKVPPGPGKMGGSTKKGWRWPPYL